MVGPPFEAHIQILKVENVSQRTSCSNYPVFPKKSVKSTSRKHLGTPAPKSGNRTAPSPRHTPPCYLHTCSREERCCESKRQNGIFSPECKARTASLRLQKSQPHEAQSHQADTALKVKRLLDGETPTALCQGSPERRGCARKSFSERTDAALQKHKAQSIRI